MLETTVNILGGISIGLLLGSLGMLYCNRWHVKRYRKIDNKLHTATWKLEDYQKLAVLDETKGYLSMDWCLGWERTADGGIESTCPYDCT